MATIYVDFSSPTNGTGTFLSPRNVVPTSLVYGDIVLLKENTEKKSGWTIPTPTGVGSKTNIILISTYDANTGLQTLDSTKRAKIQASLTQDAILVSSIDYVKVQNLWLVGGRDFPYSGFRALNSSYTTVDRCKIQTTLSSTGGGAYGIRLDNATGSGSSRSEWVISNNTISDINGNAGVLCVWSATTGEYVSNISIVNNHISGLKYISGSIADGIGVQGRASVFYTDRAGLCGKGVQIKGNTIVSAPSFGIYLKGVNSSTTTQTNLVQNNTILNTGTGAVDMHCLWLGACSNFTVFENNINKSTALINGNTGTGIGIFVDYPSNTLDGCEDILISRNIVSYTGGGNTANAEVGGAGIFVLHSKRIVVSFNLVQYCLNGIVVWGGNSAGDKSTNVQVYNNTVVHNKAVGIYVCKIADLVTVKNNLLFDNDTGVYIETSGAGAITNYVEQYNLVWNCANKWTEGDAPTVTVNPTNTTRVPDASNLETNPHLDQTYNIKNNSTAYQTGIFISPSNSLSGATNNPPSIGAYEYVKVRGTR